MDSTNYKNGRDNSQTYFSAEVIEDRKRFLSNLLKENVLEVTFVKKDGEERRMKCTLQKDVAIPYEKKTDRERIVKDDILPVWDLDKGAWRSINLSTVQAVVVFQ